MSHFVNLDNSILRHELTKELTHTVAEILRSFSSIGDKGRIIDGVAFSHIIHEVIPDEIDKTLKNFNQEGKII